MKFLLPGGCHHPMDMACEDCIPSPREASARGGVLVAIVLVLLAGLMLSGCGLKKVRPCEWLGLCGVLTPTPRPTPEPTSSPGPEPTATSVPTAVPTTSPTPVPTVAPTPASCPCLVICTVAFLGINDGPPPPLEVNGEARLDITCRWATHNGDGRGQPCDRGACGGRRCEVARNPVTWSIVTPGGVGQHFFNDGYGLRLSPLKAGDYRINVRPREGAENGEEETVVSCAWPHGDSVRDSIAFGVR